MLDNYFSTGNVYIIDDQKNEASPLIDSLFRHQIPHVYMDGTAGKLPKKPKQVRLIFLDLNLKQGTNPLDKKSFKGNHAGILNRLLANNSSSYIILVWSKEEKTYLGDFKEIFNAPNDEYKLNDRQPLDIISLEKTKFFESSVDEGGGVNYKWKKGQEATLYSLIKDKLIVNEAFKTLSAWESLICKSGSKTVDYLFELVKGETQKNINSKLDSIITSLSISYLGIDNFLASNDQKKTDAFMLALSELIDDEIDKEIIINNQPEFKNWVPKKRLKDKDKGKLNSKLLTSVEINQKLLTGSILKGDKKKHDFEKMLLVCIDEERKSTKKLIKLAQDKKGAEELTRKEKLKIKEVLTKQISSNVNEFIPIELNITPLCDVVQNKQEYYRLVPGFLINLKNSEYLFKNTDRNYFSPLLFSESILNECLLVLDYRYLHSISKVDIEKMTKLCSLRKSFVDEIQSKLANHVSRLGILYLP